MPVAGSVSWVNFNPHSPCGERRGFRRQRLAVHISIHTPLAGSDWLIVSWSVTVRVFQSTLPLRGATFLLDNRSIYGLFQSTLPLRGATAEMRHF